MSIAFAWNESHEHHGTSRHVERPERLQAILKLVDHSPIRRRLRTVSYERASLDLLRLVHSDTHIRHVVDAVERGFDRLDPDTYITAGSLDAALDAVGALIAVTRDVVDGRSQTGFAAVRPPGHHATSDHAMGFCLFSNVAVAARWAQREAGIGRVLIVDFDVHHGNGTQDIFYDDPTVMYMSVHQAPFYPGTGAIRERGEGGAAGTTLNVPLPGGTGDAGFRRVFEEIFQPHAEAFRPELILLSAGYDAHWKDLLGGMHVSASGFAELVRLMRGWADEWSGGRIVAALEGGYHLDALAISVLATLEVLNDPEAAVEDPIGPSAEEETDVSEYVTDVAAQL